MLHEFFVDLLIFGPSLLWVGLAIYIWSVSEPDPELESRKAIRRAYSKRFITLGLYRGRNGRLELTFFVLFAALGIYAGTMALMIANAFDLPFSALIPHEATAVQITH